jgi:membrane protein
VAWIVVLGAVIAVLILFYKYGPSRTPPKIVWTLPGAAFASLGWLLGSLLFSLYVSLFSRYNETYGTLGAVVILLTWFYMSAFLVLLGGEVNAVIEHETSVDTTEGPPRPKGRRGARVADADPSEPISPEPTSAEASGAER